MMLFKQMLLSNKKDTARMTAWSARAIPHIPMDEASSTTASIQLTCMEMDGTSATLDFASGSEACTIHFSSR